jgi:hypothetical protein
MFLQDCGENVNELTSVITSYITFCYDLHAVKKEITIFPNNKPWVSSQLRKDLVNTHKSFGTSGYEDNHKKLCTNIRKAKQDYKMKVEALFTSNNTRDAWRGLKILTGMEKVRRESALISAPGADDRLNDFYCRFDDKDFRETHHDIKTTLSRNMDNSSFSLNVDVVKESLRKVKVRKASGPDGIGGRLIKSCQSSLLYVIHKLFELSLSTGTYPSVWKVGEVVPVEKRPLPQCDNDFRPVTLTDVLSKCLERVGLSLLMPIVEHAIDPLQFAYIRGRSTADAVTTALHRITSHLDARSSNTARVLFLDYSSAFNTIQPHLMVNKLNNLNVPEILQLWILDYLTNRTQYVRTSCEKSRSRVLNTGAPQGCVLSPVLFVLYTNDLHWDSENVFICKYADDTMITGLVTSDNITEYLECIDFVNSWCSENYLQLNVSKTKELLFDFRKQNRNDEPVMINELPVEICNDYKYLGIKIDSKLRFTEHVDYQYKRSCKKLYYVRTMAKLKVNIDLTVMFFNAVILPVITYGCASFYSYLSNDQKCRLDKPRKICCKLVRLMYDNDNIPSVFDLYKSHVLNMANKIIDDASHPLHKYFILLPSRRRYRLPAQRTTRYRNSFIPVALRLLNDQ